MIGGAVVDGAFGPGAIPYAAAVLPLLALLFILTQERRSETSVRSRPLLDATR
jgi:DHA1 family inner membrane transport protein